MYYKRIAVIVLTIILGVGAVGVLCYNQYEESRQAQSMREKTGKSKSLEKKKEALNDEIEQKRIELMQTSIKPMLVISFSVETVEQTNQALAWVKEYMSGEKVTFLLNPQTEKTVNDQIIELLNSASGIKAEVAFYGSLKKEETRHMASQLQEQLEKSKLSLSNYWFISDNSSAMEHMAWLKENKMIGYSQPTDYTIYINSGELQGLYHMEYVPVKVGDHKIRSTLRLCVEGNTVVSVLFPMKSLCELNDTDRKGLVKGVFAIIEEKSEALYTVTPKEVSQYYEEQSKDQRTKKQTFEDFKEQKEAEIQELDQKIKEIYNETK